MITKYSFFAEASSDSDKRQRNRENLISGGAGLASITALNAATVAPLKSKLLKGKTPMNVIDNLPEQLKHLKVNGTENISDYLKRNNIRVYNVPHKLGPHFNPVNNYINLGIKDKHMSKYGKSIFAHELGHSVKMGKNGKAFPIGKVATYGISKNLTGVSVVSQIVNCFNNDDESRQKIGKALSVAGGVTSIPMIAEEIGASIRGTKMLGLKGGDKARAFIGVGSYVAAALSPAIIYHVSERTRKFLIALKKAKDESPTAQQKLENLKQKDIKVQV